MFRSPSHNFKGSISLPALQSKSTTATIKDFTHCAGHTSPLAEIRCDDGNDYTVIAAEGAKVGDIIQIGENAEIKLGSILPLKKIPEGTMVFNIELQSGDGGKMVRSSGTFAKIFAKTETKVTLILPSKKQKIITGDCRAIIGVAAGGSRTEKPFMKAGIKHYAMRARGKFWPRVSATAMNAVNHPFGGKRTSRKGQPTIAPRFAPPGRKVGMFKPATTGRGK